MCNWTFSKSLNRDKSNIKTIIRQCEKKTVHVNVKKSEMATMVDPSYDKVVDMINSIN